MNKTQKSEKIIKNQTVMHPLEPGEKRENQDSTAMLAGPRPRMLQGIECINRNTFKLLCIELCEKILIPPWLNWSIMHVYVFLLTEPCDP